jgi:hypothetical protein
MTTIRSLVFLTTLAPLLAGAQDSSSFSIRQSTIDGGGGTSSGGGFTVHGTAGQAAAARSAGGSFEIQSGFWRAVQTPGAPPLSITRLPDRSVRVSWKLPADNWVLDGSAALGRIPSPWLPVPEKNIDTNPLERFYLIPNASGRFFFRLRHL